MLTIDRFGLNNAYYSEDNQSKYYTNIRDLISSNGFDDYSPDGLSSFFTFRYPVLNYTMFEGIEKLDLSQCPLKEITCKNSIFRYSSNTNISEKSAVEKILFLTEDSIKKIVGDKNIIAVTLSGGLDSSLILALCRKIYPRRKIYTYSCGFYGEDEFEYSRKVASMFSDKHEEIVLTKDDFLGPSSIARDLIKHKCAPLHPNETALGYAEKYARQDGCDIVLCGEGADDIFGGYSHNLRMYMKHKGDNINFFYNIIENYRYFSNEERQFILNPKYCRNIENDINIFEEDKCPKKIENLMLYFIQRLHTRGLIERGNNALSFNCFEPGFPFISDELVDYVNQLPFEYKIYNKKPITKEDIEHLSYIDISDKYDEAKYILKKIAEKFLPADIVYRTKKGFPVPFEDWFKDDQHWDLDKNIFKTNDISKFSGWKKYMIINLNMFINIFNSYKNNI